MKLRLKLIELALELIRIIRIKIPIRIKGRIIRIKVRVIRIDIQIKGIKFY